MNSKHVLRHSASLSACKALSIGNIHPESIFVGWEYEKGVGSYNRCYSAGIALENRWRKWSEWSRDQGQPKRENNWTIWSFINRIINSQCCVRLGRSLSREECGLQATLLEEAISQKEEHRKNALWVVLRFDGLTEVAKQRNTKFVAFVRDEKKSRSCKDISVMTAFEERYSSKRTGASEAGRDIIYKYVHLAFKFATRNSGYSKATSGVASSTQGNF